MAGRPHPRRKKFQPRNGGTGDRGGRARPINANHHPLRRRRPLRSRCRKSSTSGLQKREVDGRRLQSLEDRRLACDKITRAWRRVEAIAESNSEFKLSADCLVMAEAPL